MTELNLLYTDVEDALRESVRSVLRTHCPPDAVTALYDHDRSIVAPLWKLLGVDLGLSGLLVPESADGAGASAREAAVVQEELGWFAAPTPFLTSAGIATTVLTQAVRNSPGHGEIRLHAAVVFGARGIRDVAEAQLKEALMLDPELEAREEVTLLRARLKELASAN